MDDGTTCGKPISHFGMCKGHNTRQKNGTPMGTPWQVHQRLAGQPCPILMDDGADCGRPIKLNGMCLSHDQRKKAGRPMGAPWRVTKRKP